VVELMLPWQPPALVFFALRDIPAGQELSVDYRPADNTQGRERYSNTVREGGRRLAEQACTGLLACV
jgi:hypothetical protein